MGISFDTYLQLMLIIITLTANEIIFSSALNTDLTTSTTNMDFINYGSFGTSKVDSDIEEYNFWTTERSQVFAENTTDVISGKSDNREVYLWDKAKISAKDFQQSFCPQRCRDGIITDLHNLCFNIACFQCDCERPRCEIYGICCPDLSEPFFPPPDPGTFSKLYSTETLRRSTETNVSSSNGGSQIISPTVDANAEVIVASKGFIGGLQLASLNFAKTSLEEEKNSKNVDFSVKAQPLKLVCDEISNVLVVKSCSGDVQVSSEVTQKCESGLPEEEITVDSYAYISDNNTNVVYYNKFCAECNDVNKTMMWGVSVWCETYIKVYSAQSPNELIRQSLRTDSLCHVEQINPIKNVYVPCTKDWQTDHVVDTCNVTGLWRDYDEDVVRGCATLTEDIYMVTIKPENDQYFKNVFCAICNMAKYPSNELCTNRPTCDSSIFPYTPPLLSVLFGPPVLSPQDPSVMCNDTEWPAPDGTCAPVVCSPGKNLVNGSCETSLTQIKGLGYRLQLWFVPEIENVTTETCMIDTPPSQFILSTFYFQLLKVMKPLVGDFQLSIGAVVDISIMGELHDIPSFYENHRGVGDSSSTTFILPSTNVTISQSQFVLQIPHLFWVNGFVLDNRYSFSRDEFEKAMVDQLLRKQILVTFAEGMAVNFNPVMMWENSEADDYCSKIDQYGGDIKCYKTSALDTSWSGSENFSRFADLFLNLTNILTCSYVTYQRSLYVVENSVHNFKPKLLVTLNIGNTKLIFKDNSELSKMAVNEHEDLQVCRDLLEEKVKSLKCDESDVDVMKAVQYVLTLVCMGVSMICLMLTLATYMKFPVLRSVAGWNNIGLSASLLLAQASLIASGHTSLNSVTCAPLGIATHYLWLCMFSWSFVCCFYMYKVFGAKIRSSITSHRSQSLLLVKSITFSVLAPAVVVVVVVVAVYTMSGGKDFGYGGSGCYLNSGLLVGAAMIGPVVAMVTSNTIFFLITVMNINRVRKLKKQDTPTKDDYQSLVVYVKLSTVTGCFWVITIMAENLDVDVLRILAIILNCLQGVFIFVSYTCNKRVLNLYLQSLGRQTPVTSFSSTTSVRGTGTAPSPKRLQKEDTLKLKRTIVSIASNKDNTI